MTLYNRITNSQTGEVTEVPYTPEEEAAYYELFKPKEKDFAEAIQRHIDAAAQSRQYENGIALASYDSSSIAEWAQEAQTFIEWRDSVWNYAFTELEKVKNNTRPYPTIDELISELPVIVWPQ